MIYLWQTANAVYNKAVEIKAKRYNVFSVGLYQVFSDTIPSELTKVMNLYKKVMKDSASTPGDYYAVDNLDDLEFVFGQVADDIGDKNTKLTDDEIETLAGLAESSYTLKEKESYKSWKLEKQYFGDSRFSFSRFEKDGSDSIVYAFRGTPFPEDFNLFTVWAQTLGYYIPATSSQSGQHKQDAALKKFLDEEVYPKMKESNKSIYFVGHSLGGWLSLKAYLYANDKGESYARKVKGVVTFNTIGIAKNDSTKVLGYYNDNPKVEIKNYYVCCDVARWYGKEKGFAFPGDNYIINEPHWQIGIKCEADGGTWYQHAHEKSSATLLTQLKKIKNLMGKDPLTTGLKWFYYGLYLPYGELPLDGVMPYPPEVRSAYSTIMVRVDSHVNYKGLVGYANLEGTPKNTSPNTKVIIRIACPVDVEITYNGETLSSNTKAFKPRTSWGELSLTGEENDEKTVALNSDKNMKVNLKGTGKGSMNYYISYYYNSGVLKNTYNAIEIPVTDKTKMTTTTNNNDLSIYVDKNGNGIYDYAVSLKTGEIIPVVAKKLSKPTGLKLTKKKAKWIKVKNNSGYILKIMQKKKAVKTVQIKKKGQINYKIPKKLFKKGIKYYFTLVAKGKGNFKNSKRAKSKTITIKKK